jgi:hypothetical protein
MSILAPDPIAVVLTPSDVRYKAGYAFGSACIDVDVDTADAGRWLEEFLRPWAEATVFGRGDVCVRLICSPALFDTFVRRRATDTPTPIPCFSLDSQLIALPGWNEGGAMVLEDREFGCFYRIDGRYVEIVAQPGTRKVRLALMRVVREMLASRALRRESLLDLHAAAFVVGRHAVLLAGQKRAGKTTLLSYAIAGGGAQLLANDRVFVDVDRAPGEVYGVPTIVSVRPGTLDLFPGLRRTPDERPVLLHTDERETARESAAPGRSFALSPGQFAQRLQASCLRSAPLAAIVFPEISTETETWSVEALSAAEGHALLETCLYGRHGNGRPSTVLESFGGAVPRRNASAPLVDRIPGQVRFLRCTLGPRAYEGSARAWLDALGLDAAGA